MDIEHISVSRHQTWTLCQESYRFKYHLKVKSQVEEPFYFVYGKIVHKIAEAYVNYKGQKNISEVASEVLHGKIGLGREEDKEIKCPALPMSYKYRLPEHLSAIKKLTDKLGYEGQLEYPFYYDLDPPHNRNIKGFIDRLTIKQDWAWIVDYKTTKKGIWRKTPQTIRNDLQLRIYARVVQKTFGIKSSNILAALHYLEGGNLICARFDDKSLLDAEAELLKAYKEIESLPEERSYGNVGPHCNRCDYRKLCKFYSLVGEGK